ncbi:PepSY-associated TM helix domain-containing protein [Pacificimonas sp. ICDLI1SI03]
MSWLHSWGGLIAGWIGFAIFLTGTIAVFDDEITRWSSPELSVEGPARKRQIVEAMAALDARSPAYWFAALPSTREPAMRLIWEDEEGKIERAHLDPATGRLFTPRDTGGGAFFTEFHYTLHSGDVGLWIVAAISVAMLVAITSGIIVHRRIFKDFFTFRPRAANRQRSWLDLHNAIGVVCLPFIVMIIYTGLTIKAPTYLPVPEGPRSIDTKTPFAQSPLAAARPQSISALYESAQHVLGKDKVAFVTVSEGGGETRFVASRVVNDRLTLDTDTATFDRVTGALLGTKTVDRPAYQTQRVMAGMHFGHFGGTAVRWLYFVLGLLGSGLIATGLVIFSIKRPSPWRDAISVTAVAGLVLASIAYIASARALPVAIAGRPEVEVGIFLAVLCLSFLHAVCRPVVAAWREQAAFGGVAAAAIVLAWVASGGASTGDRALVAMTAVLALLSIFLIWFAMAFPRLVERTPSRNRAARQAT